MYLPQTFEIESDATSASYPLAMAAITGGLLTVESVGSNSIQGDAQFCEVLKKMGCKVEQTPTTTTVEAPANGQLKAIDIDMNRLTDTFMTAAVLMTTTPKGTISKITNIANQRVKECDRIAAMVTELTKCGVKAYELADGIAIEGQGRQPPDCLLKRDRVDIHCYNDHRIAMSFAVLGCLWPNICITDKDCTDKTYPEFWDDVCKLHRRQDAVRAVVLERKKHRPHWAASDW